MSPARARTRSASASSIPAGRPADARTADKVLACTHHQVIPLEVAKAAYEILGIPIPPDPWRELRGDPEIQRRWRDGPNLVANSGFEEPDAAGDGPADWQPIEKGMAWTANPDGPGERHTVEADFVPSATRPEHAPTFLRVDLYAYWPEGVVYWDDVVLKKVRDARPGPPPASTDAEPLNTESPPEAKEMP